MNSGNRLMKNLALTTSIVNDDAASRYKGLLPAIQIEISCKTNRKNGHLLHIGRPTKVRPAALAMISNMVLAHGSDTASVKAHESKLHVKIWIYMQLLTSLLRRQYLAAKCLNLVHDPR